MVRLKVAAAKSDVRVNTLIEKIIIEALPAVELQAEADVARRIPKS